MNTAKRPEYCLFIAAMLRMLVESSHWCVCLSLRFLDDFPTMLAHVSFIVTDYLAYPAYHRWVESTSDVGSLVVCWMPSCTAYIRRYYQNRCMASRQAFSFIEYRDRRHIERIHDHDSTFPPPNDTTISGTMPGMTSRWPCPSHWRTGRNP